MHLKFFGKEQGGLSYVLRDPTAQVLDGHPNLTQGLIDSITGRQRYTAGVLSEIDPLEPEIRVQAISEAEYQLRSGLPSESLSGVWVRHSGKDRDEAHFVAANLEVITGRPYTPYIDRIDRHRFKAWGEHFNITHGLPDPNSRLRIRPDYTKSRLPMEQQTILMEVWTRIHKRVVAGLIINRTELVAYLRTTGYKVRDETDKGRPLEQPVLTLENGTILRLKGSCYYHKDFTPALLLPKQDQVCPEVVAARLKELRETVMNGLEFRAFHTIGHLFGRAEQRRVERVPAREYLAHLMHTKLTEWEVPEAPLPLFVGDKLRGLGTLIEMQDQGVDYSKIPVLRKSEKPASGAVKSQKHAQEVAAANPPKDFLSPALDNEANNPFMAQSSTSDSNEEQKSCTIEVSSDPNASNTFGIVGQFSSTRKMKGHRDKKRGHPNRDDYPADPS